MKSVGTHTIWSRNIRFAACQKCDKKLPRLGGTQPKWCDDCRPDRRIVRACRRCGAEFMSRHSDRNNYARRDYCGPECFPRVSRERQQARDRERKAVLGRAQAKLNRAASGVPPRWSVPLFATGECGVCRKHFVHVFTSHTNAKNGAIPAMLCSDECLLEHKRRGRRAMKAKRRAARRDTVTELVRPHVVFERDDWICGICDDPVDPDRQYPDRMCATLDHIIPLARGGSHTYDNLQCAHWICNTRKSDRIAA